MMAFEKFIRTRTIDRSSPVASLSKSHFHFNAVAARLAELTSNTNVIYHFDEANRKIGFEFTSATDDRSSYSIFKSRGSNSFRSSIGGVFNRFLWVRSVAILPNSEDRRFLMRLVSNLWVIQLCPAFEISALSVADVPRDAVGVYRYLDAKNEIIYIGKGNVRQRRAEQGRDDWGISAIQYSIVNDEDKQYEWEGYWIEKYKEKNSGSLPPFNRVSGIVS